MDHPYKEFEGTKLWETIENSLNDLKENGDIEITTSPEYVIGYICKSLESLEHSEG